MRRLSFALVPAMVAGLLVIGAGPASADTTIVSKTGLPAGWTFTNFRYDGKPGDSTYQHVEGPAGVPTGIGSLQLNHGLHTFKMDLHFTTGVATPAADMTTYEITYRSTTTFNVDLGFTAPGMDASAVAKVELPASDTWTTVDLLAEPIHVLVDPHFSEIPGSPFTWAALKTAFPGGSMGSGTIEVWTQKTDTVWLDTVRFGSAGAVTTWDFDTDLIPVITSSTATVSLKAGASTPLSGRVKRPSGDPIASLPVDLWTKVWGTGTWVKAQTVLTGADGAFTTTFTPVKQTYVQWRVNQSGYAEAISATRRVDVTTKIWATPADTTVSRPDRVRIFGKVAPNLAGTTVTLRRVGSTTALATATIKADSTYGVSALLPRGTWTVYVTTQSGGGLIGGKSAGIKVVVS